MIVPDLSPRSRWWLGVTAATGGLLILLLLLLGFYRQELYHYTGTAEWIWVTNQVDHPRPTAALFIKGLTLFDRPQRAVAKICGDRQYVLWINGQPAMAGRNRPKFHLDVVPVTDLMKAGRNIIAVEVRSYTSVGAVLFALDLTPSAEGRRHGDPRGRNVIVSDRSWGVTESWTGGMPDMLPDHPARPWVWGRPPDHPWSYPPPVLHERTLVQATLGDVHHLTARDFKRVGPQRWICNLETPFGGLMWLTINPDGTSDTIAMIARGAHRPAKRPAAVVNLLGETRWLYPGRVRGDEIIVTGAHPPAGIDLQPSLDTRVR
jgi:hypothetical protein